jgi:hypothetical protein
MKKLDRVRQAYLTLAAILILVAALITLLGVTGVIAGSWGQPQITLKPGVWQTVEFTNPENEPENLVVTNISAPVELLPYVFVSPASVPPLSTENVTIQFAYIPTSVRQAIQPDVYAVQINGLLVYLDLTIPTENIENAENLQRKFEDLTSRLDAIGAQIDNLLARVELLENEPACENLRPEIENIRAELQLLKAAHLENSPDNSWMGAAENLQARYDGIIGQLKLDYEEQIARAKEEAIDTATKYAAIAVVASVVIVVLFIRLIKPSEGEGESKPNTSPPPERPPTEPQTSW